MNTEVLTQKPDLALRALHDSEQRYQRLLTSMTDYIYSVTVHGGRSGTTSHGPGCEAITGYSAREFETHPQLWYEIIYEEDRPAVLSQIARVLEGEGARLLEHRILHKDGQLRWIRNTIIPQKDEEGRLVSYDGHITDITEQRRAEQLLMVQCAATSELAKASTLAELMAKVLRTLCETFSWELAVFWSVDEKAGVLRCQAAWHRNSARLERFEGEREDFCFASGVGLPGKVWAEGQPIWIVDIHAEDEFRRTPFVSQDLHAACGFPLNRGVNTVGVIEMFHRGKLRPDPQLLDVLTAIGSQINQFVARKRADQALRATQERFALAARGANDGIWDWNVKTNEVYFSPRWKSMLGYGEDEIENNFAAWERLLHPDDRACAIARIQSCFSGESETYELEHRLRHKDGSYRWILARGVALRDAEGRPSRMAGSHMDLTARKEAEQRLQQTCQELAQSQASLKELVNQLNASHEELRLTQFQLIQSAKLESVGTLAAGVAHEVRNPLQTILLGLDYLNGSLPNADETAKMALSEMRVSVERADAIVREMLQLAAATDFQPRPEDLNAVIEQSLWLVKKELLTAQIKVVRNLATALPPVLLDAPRLEQVFINLFLNSIQAMSPGGTLCVSTRLVQIDPESRKREPLLQSFKPGVSALVAEVKDSGTGIPEKNLARIFDPFFTTRPAGGGTGLGLWVVKNVVELHGGAIGIRNAPEGGALATLILKTDSKPTNGEEANPHR